METSIGSALDVLLQAMEREAFRRIGAGDLSEAINILRKMVSTKELLAEHLDPSLSDQEKQLIRDGKFIDAIKEVRARLGLSLKQAKELADAYRSTLPSIPY